MKSIFSVLILLFFSQSTFASTIATCMDKNDPYGDVNFMMVRHTAAGKYKLMQLTLDGTEYFSNLDGSIYCEAGALGPIGGIQGGKELKCNIAEDLVAFIKYQDKGVGSAVVYNLDNKRVADFSYFVCE